MLTPIPIEILLVEDSPGEVRLTQEALKDGKVRNRLHVVEDGVEALAYLRQQGNYADVPLVLPTITFRVRCNRVQ